MAEPVQHPNELSQAIPSGKGGGGKYQKVVLIILGFVLLLLVSEGVYFFSTKQDLVKNPNPTLPPITESPIPAPANEGAKVINLRKLDSLEETLKAFEIYSQFVENAYANITVSGKVVEVFKDDEIVDGIPHNYFIAIKTQSDQILYLRFRNDEIENAELFLLDSVGGASRNIGFEVIQVGDSIAIHNTFNFLDSSANTDLTLEITR